MKEGRGVCARGHMFDYEACFDIIQYSGSWLELVKVMHGVEEETVMLIGCLMQLVDKRRCIG